jgi:spore coat protein JB
VKKDKLLRRLSAMQFAMWEMREFLDTHPNCPDATALYNAYKEKYDTLAKEYEARFGPLTLNGANSDAWLQDPWPWEAGFDTDE